MPKSIITNDMDHCFVCGCGGALHIHHCIGGTSNRKNSDKYGLIIPLCPRHHNMSNEGIHFNKPLDAEVKKIAQLAFEKLYSREEFIRIFGKSYIWED